jgi:hypothetical protein
MKFIISPSRHGMLVLVDAAPANIPESGGIRLPPAVAAAIRAEAIRGQSHRRGIRLRLASVGVDIRLNLVVQFLECDGHFGSLFSRFLVITNWYHSVTSWRYFVTDCIISLTLPI